jgi:hypothetical protein
VGACDPSSGECLTVPAPDGTACDDRLDCTVSDLCLAGICTGTDGCASGEVCQGNGQCAATVTSVFRNDGSYGGTHDTTLEETSPDTNLGADSSWEWDAESGDPPGQKIGLLRFADVIGLGPGQVTPGSLVVSAVIGLQVWDPTTGLPGDIRDVLVDWDEDVVTWNDFGGDPGVQPDEFGSHIADAPVDLGAAEREVTASVQAWADDPATNRGWVCLPNANNGVEVRSSEYSTQSLRPQLTVQWLPPCLTDSECDDGLECNGSEVCVSGRCQLGDAPPRPEVGGVLVQQDGVTTLTWSDLGAGILRCGMSRGRTARERMGRHATGPAARRGTLLHRAAAGRLRPGQLRLE